MIKDKYIDASRRLIDLTIDEMKNQKCKMADLSRLTGVNYGQLHDIFTRQKSCKLWTFLCILDGLDLEIRIVRKK